MTKWKLPKQGSTKPGLAKRRRVRAFLLARDVIQILEDYKRERKAGSLALALEELVRDWKRSQTDHWFKTYCGNPSNKEPQEDLRWGEISESRM